MKRPRSGNCRTRSKRLEAQGLPIRQTRAGRRKTKKKGRREDSLEFRRGCLKGTRSLPMSALSCNSILGVRA